VPREGLRIYTQKNIKKLGPYKGVSLHCFTKPAVFSILITFDCSAVARICMYVITENSKSRIRVSSVLL
jgi:hypothetical protein